MPDLFVVTGFPLDQDNSSLTRYTHKPTQFWKALSKIHIAGTSERLGIWYGYSIETIVFFKQYMIYFE